MQFHIPFRLFFQLEVIFFLFYLGKPQLFLRTELVCFSFSQLVVRYEVFVAVASHFPLQVVVVEEQVF
jgi:hypothetical protein